MESNYTPIKEATANEGPYSVDLAPLANALPSWIKAEEIGVDLGALLEICRITRCRSLKVCGVQESGELKANIAGVNADASIVGTAVRHKPKHRLEQRFSNWLGDNLDGGRSTDFRDIELYVNFEIFRERMEKDGLPLRDTAYWAEFINESLISELGKISAQRLQPEAKTAAMEFIGSPGVVLLWNLYKSIKPFVDAVRSREKPKIGEATIGLFFLIYTATAIGSAAIDPRMGLYFYGMIFATIKFYLAPQEIERRAQEKAEQLGIPIYYDPVTAFTIGNFEWDRLLKAFQLLHRAKLVQVGN